MCDLQHAVFCRRALKVAFQIRDINTAGIGLLAKDLNLSSKEEKYQNINHWPEFYAQAFIAIYTFHILLY
jgi:uncharacterized protein (DUF2225 family)